MEFVYVGNDNKLVAIAADLIGEGSRSIWIKPPTDRKRKSSTHSGVELTNIRGVRHLLHRSMQIKLPFDHRDPLKLMDWSWASLFSFLWSNLCIMKHFSYEYRNKLAWMGAQLVSIGISKWKTHTWPYHFTTIDTVLFFIVGTKS